MVAVSQDLWAIGRIIVTVAVMYFAMQGYKWAKWVLIAIFSLVVVLLTALIVALHSKLSTFLVVGSLIMIILTIIVGSFMIFNRDLARYFTDRRKAAIKPS
ncbi:tweety family protein [Pleurocapsa sp. PCC 7319]|uniref:tweety family protein n=1 Tax=Pleurocapsa sp. PCC 7319 TaxID=118161 RepID=UPI00034D2650|nr:tweety family protein [Pleurocapsa sp. PCC 7319]